MSMRCIGNAERSKPRAGEAGKGIIRARGSNTEGSRRMRARPRDERWSEKERRRRWSAKMWPDEWDIPGPSRAAAAAQREIYEASFIIYSAAARGSSNRSVNDCICHGDMADCAHFLIIVVAIYYIPLRLLQYHTIKKTYYIHIIIHIHT